jgi:hypothetical protein
MMALALGCQVIERAGAVEQADGDGVDDGREPGAPAVSERDEHDPRDEEGGGSPLVQVAAQPRLDRQAVDDRQRGDTHRLIRGCMPA